MRTTRVVGLLASLLLTLQMGVARAETAVPADDGVRSVLIQPATGHAEPGVGELVKAQFQNLRPGDRFEAARWFVDGVAEAGATGGGFVPEARHVGSVLRFEITVVATTGVATRVVSNSLGPVVLGIPTIAAGFGATFAGETAQLRLTTHPADATVESRQWLLDGTPVLGATGQTLRLTKAMAGRHLGIAVELSADGYETVVATHEDHRPIGGAVVQGGLRFEQLSDRGFHVSPDQYWQPAGVISFAYQWLLDGKVVPGATKQELHLGPEASGKVVSVRVTGANPELLPATVTSESVRLSIAPDPVPELDVYTTPGRHSHNGREWDTTCEPYSQTSRCRTDIIASTVKKQDDGTYRLVKDWTFNNITYRSSSASLWKGNPLVHPGEWTASDGRRWKTECFATTLPHVCRSFTWSHYMIAEAGHPGYTYLYVASQGWVFNNQVHLR